MKKYLTPLLIIAVIIIIGIVVLRSRDRKTVEPPTTRAMVAQLFARKSGQPADSLVVEVAVDTGVYARGTVRYADQTGGVWFAANTERGWELAYDGNGIITCDAVDAYQFPKDIVPQCIDLRDGNRLIQR